MVEGKLEGVFEEEYLIFGILKCRVLKGPRPALSLAGEGIIHAISSADYSIFM